MIGVLSSHRGECCHTPNSLLMVSAPTHIRGPIPFLTDLLVSGLEEIGHKVTLVSCWGRRQEKESLWSKTIQRLRDIALILRESRTDNFDLIYVHTSHDIGTLLRDIPLLTALWLRRTPIVVLLHGSDVEQLESHRRRLFFFGTEILFRLATGVLVYSSEEQRVFANLWPWARCGIVSQPMIAPPSSGAGTLERRGGDDLLTLVFAGRFIPKKGVLDILDAFPKVLNQLDCRLVFAGDGPLLDEMRQRVEMHGLQESVEFTGYLDRQAMWRLYQRADVLLLPTYDHEGMPTVIVEAMACGLGIICSQIRGVADSLQEDKNALFVPPKCPETLADRVTELLSNPDKLARMKKSNLDLSRQFEPSQVAHQHIEVIRSFGLLQNVKDGWNETDTEIR